MYSTQISGGIASKTLAATSFLLLWSSTSVADLELAPNIAMTMQNTSANDWWGYQFDTDSYGDTTGSGNFFQYTGETAWTECDVSWWHDLEVDPGLGFGFSVTNNLSYTESFQLTAEVTVPGWNDGTFIGASIGGSVSDSNFDGNAELVGRSDGLLTTLLDDMAELEVGQNVSATTGFAGTTNFGPFSLGLSDIGPTIAGPNATNGVLSIEINFTLTPGDTAVFSGAYVVEYVPGPAGVFALLGLGGMRRRRS